MQFSFLCAIAAAVSSAKALGDIGFNLGVKDNDGLCKTAVEYANDFDHLKSHTSIVKTYAVSDCNTLEILGPAAELAGFQVILGVWTTDESHFSAEKEALKSFLPNISKSTVKVFSVGSEVLYREEMTASELADAIDEIRDLLKTINDKNGDSYESVPVGFTDSWNILVDDGSAPAIQSADFVFANAFSYWQGQSMNNASYSFFDDIMQALQVIQTLKGLTDIEFWVGETGWPTEGTSFESASPTLSNAKQYWQQAICAIRAWGINTCVFEAHDEAWKPDTSGTTDVEKHWGVYDESYDLKYSLDCNF